MIPLEMQDFNEAMIASLSQKIKQISPKYFYDSAGSDLFDQICELPEYYPTRTEISILSEHAHAISQCMGTNVELIELGAGSLTKVRYLLQELESPTAFLAMDISGEHLTVATEKLQKEFPKIQITPVVADYTKEWSLPAPLKETRRRVAFFPGSTIGNFSPAEVEVFFKNCIRHLPTGGLLLGVDLIKAPQIIHQAYNDSKGVTAAFNLNLLARANRELKTNFELSKFFHWAFYNAPKFRIEMHLVSREKQEVSLGRHSFFLDEGETIQTENSYKFSIERIQQIAERIGLQPGPVWTDANRWFGLLWFNIPGESDLG